MKLSILTSSAGLARGAVMTVIACWLATAPALSSDGPQAAAAARSSTQALINYVTAAARTGERPDYSKPEIAQHLKRIFNRDALAHLPAPQGNDVPWLLDWYQSVNISFKILSTFGADKIGTPQAIARNMADHEDEIAVATAFLLHLQSRIMITGPIFLNSLPLEQRTDARKAGLQSAGRGMVETVTGATLTMTSPLKPVNADVISAALRDTADDWLPYTTSTERGTMLQLLTRVRAANTDAQTTTALNAVSAMISKIKN